MKNCLPIRRPQPRRFASLASSRLDGGSSPGNGARACSSVISLGVIEGSVFFCESHSFFPPLIFLLPTRFTATRHRRRQIAHSEDGVPGPTGAVYARSLSSGGITQIILGIILSSYARTDTAVHSTLFRGLVRRLARLICRLFSPTLPRCRCRLPSPASG
jgi:hypothetical protein